MGYFHSNIWSHWFQRTELIICWKSFCRSVKGSTSSNDPDSCERDIESDLRHGSVIGIGTKVADTDARFVPDRPESDLKPRTLTREMHRISPSWQDSRENTSHSSLFLSVATRSRDPETISTRPPGMPFFKFEVADKMASQLQHVTCDDKASLIGSFSVSDAADATAGGGFSPASGQSPHSSMSSPQGPKQYQTFLTQLMTFINYGKIFMYAL